MKRILLLSLVFIGAKTISAQQCDGYAQFKDGASWTMTTYDDKNKVTSTVDSKVTKVTKTGTKMSADVEQVTKNGKGKEEMKSTNNYSCDGSTFTMDLRGMMMSDKQAEAYKDMEVTFTGTLVEVPSTMNAGDSLKPVSMNMVAKTNGMQVANMTMNMTNRKVEGKETITTTAGTFECYKITYDYEMKTGFFSFKGSAKEWYSYSLGTIKYENYRKDKLESYSLITALQK